MDFSPVIALIYLLLFNLLIYKLSFFKLKGLKKRALLVAWNLKFVAALALIFIYQDSPRDKADIFRFYDDATSINSEIKGHWEGYKDVFFPWGEKGEEYRYVIRNTNNWDAGDTPFIISNNRLIIRYLALTQWLAFKSYGGTLVITLFLSFMGLFILLKLFALVFTNKIKWLYAILFFTPSLLLWSSGLTKESLIIFLLGMLAWHLFNLIQLRNIAIHIPAFLVVFILLFVMRSFVALIFLFGFIPFIINYLLPKWRPLTTYFIAIFVALSIASESDKIFSKSVWQHLSERRTAYIQLAEAENAGSLLSNLEMEAEMWPTIQHIPQALLNVFIQPLPKAPLKVTMLLAFLENLLILGFISLIFFFYKNPRKYKNLYYLLFLFSLSYFILIGLSIPVAGAISRYKIIPLLVLFIALLGLIDTQRLEKKIGLTK